MRSSAQLVAEPLITDCEGLGMAAHLLQLEHLNKYYSGIKVLDSVSLNIEQGEIHAICGENGAGKSTLIKILTGAIEPSSGTVSIDGISYDKLTPKQSMELGIAVIYQEFSLIPYLSVVENVFYGREISRYGIRNQSKMNTLAHELCEELGIEIDIHAKIHQLGIAHQQIVEILKAVALQSRIIIMDEPTAPLTLKETKLFFQLIHTLKEKGKTIIFISHRLEEVFELCDRVTVLCDGKKILTEPIAVMNRAKLVAAMVGRELVETYPKSKNNVLENEIVLDVTNLENEHIHDISFSLHRGEILGFGGLVGAGRTELMRVLYGIDRFHKGSIQLHGKSFTPRSPSQALQKGIGLIPEDRKKLGIIPCRSVQENLSISSLKALSSFLYIHNKKELSIVDNYIKNLRIKASSEKQLIRNLSGGNQQKVVLSKILATNCDILIFDEPTRGIDVGAKQEIYDLMIQLVETGKSIIMVSSEMPELIGMSNRILVMAAGRIQAELHPQEYSQSRILNIASNGLLKSE